AAEHSAVGDRRKTGRSWGKIDDEVLAAAREWATLADAGAASEATGGRIRGPLREAEEAQEETERAWAQVDGLEEAFRLRGGWNRAFLVAGANGHVNASTSCSTCHSTPTD